MKADLCIIGGGPAGLSLAWQLLGSGLRVLVIESGAAHPSSGGQPYPTSTSVGLPYPLAKSRTRGLGGSANHWDIMTGAGGPRVRLREMDALDFEDRRGLRSPGWPFSRTAVEPYYQRARALCQLQPARPEDDAPLHHGLVTRLFSFGPASVFTLDLPARLERDHHTTVLTDAVVTELHASRPGGPVDHVVGRSSGGTRFTAHARAYVLAAGGFENARLMLASRAGTPAGLGNSYDQVGRCFMEHPHFASALVRPHGLSLRAQPDTWDIFMRDGHPVQRKYGLSDEVQRREGLLSIVYYLTPRPWNKPVPLNADGAVDKRAMSALQQVRTALLTRRASVSTAGQAALLLAAGPRLLTYALQQRQAQRAELRRLPHRVPQAFTLSGMAEQVPLAESRIRLGAGLDAWGVPLAELQWQASSAEGRAMRRTQELAGPVLARVLGARIDSLLPEQGLPHLGRGYHHLGTTRLSIRPESGVADADGRVHEVSNLFVAGSSVFPTGGSANPTLTLIALALRLADHLRSELSPVALSGGKSS